MPNSRAVHDGGRHLPGVAIAELSKTPAGYAWGSFGPATAGGVDSYAAELQPAGGAFVMLAKGAAAGWPESSGRRNISSAR